MLFKILDKIRTKPKSVRDQYAFGIALFFTVLVAGVWALSLPTRFVGMTDSIAAESTGTAPFAYLINQVKHQFVTTTDSMASVVTTTSATSPFRIFATSTEPLSATLNNQPIAIIISTSTSQITATTTPNYIQIATSTATPTRL